MGIGDHLLSDHWKPRTLYTHSTLISVRHTALLTFIPRPDLLTASRSHPLSFGYQPKGVASWREVGVPAYSAELEPRSIAPMYYSAHAYKCPRRMPRLLVLLAAGFCVNVLSPDLFPSAIQVNTCISCCLAWFPDPSFCAHA